MVSDLQSDVGEVKGTTTTGDRAQWGLASLLVGSVLFLAALLTLIFNVILFRGGPMGIPIGPAFAGAAIGFLVIFVLAAFGITAGLQGLRTTPDDRRTSPLAIAGVLTGIGSAILWLIVGIDLAIILATFRG